jgi:hypothetical protein
MSNPALPNQTGVVFENLKPVFHLSEARVRISDTLSEIRTLRTSAFTISGTCDGIRRAVCMFIVLRTRPGLEPDRVVLACARLVAVNHSATVVTVSQDGPVSLFARPHEGPIMVKGLERYLEGEFLKF